MTPCLIDASAAIAWLLEESRPPWLDRLVDDARRGVIRLVAPQLLWSEVGNVLGRAHGMTDDQAVDAMLRLDAIGIETIQTGRPIHLQALLLARETGLTMYDATYLAIAVSSGVPIATLDRALAAAATARGLAVGDGPHRISEPARPYASTADPVSVAAIGSALATLRQRYRSVQEAKIP